VWIEVPDFDPSIGGGDLVVAGGVERSAGFRFQVPDVPLAVVVGMGDRAQPVARPHAVAHAHPLDRYRAVLGADQRAGGHAPVAAGPQAFDVVRRMCAKKLPDGAVREFDVVTADSGAQLDAGIVGLEPRDAFDAGFDGVADRRRDDADAVPAPDPGVASGAFDMFYDVTCACVRFAGSSAA
jgi:hypothetical protein